MSGVRLGIDFGTSHTIGILSYPDGRARTLLFDGGAPLLRSAVYADPSGELLVGADAVRRSGIDPSRFESNPKQRVDETSLLLGDREIGVADVIATVLRRVATEAGRVAGGAAGDVVLTYPAAWGARRRSLLTQAASMAGLGSVRLIPEPVAAAAYFSKVLGHQFAPGEPLAVVDFGGGTLDVAVVESRDGRFNVLATGGLADLGGVDLDAAVVDHVAQAVGARHPQLWQRLRFPVTTEDRRARRLLWDDARTAKESLSRTSRAPIFIAAVDEETLLTREEFESLASPLLQRAVSETASVIEQSRRGRSRLAGLFLVGGSTRVPLLSQLLHRELGIAPTVIEQPEVAVTEGAILLDRDGTIDRTAASLRAAGPRPRPGPTALTAAPWGPGQPATVPQPTAVTAHQPGPPVATPRQPTLPHTQPAAALPPPPPWPAATPPHHRPPAPPGKGSRKPWVIGVLAVVVLLAVCVGGVVLIAQPWLSGPTGKYDYSSVDNLCDLIDTKPIAAADEKVSKGGASKTPDKAEYMGNSGTLECEVVFATPQDAEDFRSLTFMVHAYFDDGSTAKDDYDETTSYWNSDYASEEGYSIGSLPDLGKEATFLAYEQEGYESELQVCILDGNLTLEIAFDTFDVKLSVENLTSITTEVAKDMLTKLARKQ